MCLEFNEMSVYHTGKSGQKKTASLREAVNITDLYIKFKLCACHANLRK
jgi:hypothetical protein